MKCGSILLEILISLEMTSLVIHYVDRALLKNGLKLEDLIKSSDLIYQEEKGRDFTPVPDKVLEGAWIKLPNPPQVLPKTHDPDLDIIRGLI